MLIDLRHATYYRATPSGAETIEIPVKNTRGDYITTCVASAVLLTAGIKAFPCGNGDDIKLTSSQHLALLEYLKEQLVAALDPGKAAYFSDDSRRHNDE